MKKILSVVLAVMMIFAVMVPAFAVDMKMENGTFTPSTDPNTNEQKQTITVKTSDQDLAAKEKYTITIPAVNDIPWGTTTAWDVNYTVEVCQLLSTKKLTVSVTGDGTMERAGSTTDVLNYTLANNTAKDFPANLTAPATQDVEMTIANWTTGAIDVYTTQLTYTAVVNTVA